MYPDVDSTPASICRARPGTLVCDAVINPPDTRLIRSARERGLPVLDGFSMLVYQGVIGFELWTGQKPPEEVMKAALRQALEIE
jgi:shikimate dehydrogenase